MALIDLKIPNYPDCWKSCGNCGSGDIFVDEVCVNVGDAIVCDQTLIVLETGKVALDIPSNFSGKITQIFIEAGQKVHEGALIATLEAN